MGCEHTIDWAVQAVLTARSSCCESYPSGHLNSTRWKIGFPISCACARFVGFCTMAVLLILQSTVHAMSLFCHALPDVAGGLASPQAPTGAVSRQLA